MFRCSRKVRAETTQKVVFHVLSNSIFQKLFCIMVNNLTVLYNPVTSSRPSACFNTAVSTEEAGVRILAVVGETDVFVVVVADCRL